MWIMCNYKAYGHVLPLAQRTQLSQLITPFLGFGIVLVGHTFDWVKTLVLAFVMTHNFTWYNIAYI